MLIIDANNPRGKWPLGLVTRVYPGVDGIVRSVTVRTKNSELDRPVVKLRVLEQATSDTNSGEKEKIPTKNRSN